MGELSCFGTVLLLHPLHLGDRQGVVFEAVLAALASGALDGIVCEFLLCWAH